mmetsp:Transcript_17346/g.43994  ORF Transcript_17346/g.43994 Transcript_17346/m.43994 type:complete len:92 (+) Transcript_17346:122-397(+)
MGSARTAAASPRGRYLAAHRLHAAVAFQARLQRDSRRVRLPEPIVAANARPSASRPLSPRAPPSATNKLSPASHLRRSVAICASLQSYRIR